MSRLFKALKRIDEGNFEPVDVGMLTGVAESPLREGCEVTIRYDVGVSRAVPFRVTMEPHIAFVAITDDSWRHQLVDTTSINMGESDSEPPPPAVAPTDPQPPDESQPEMSTPAPRIFPDEPASPKRKKKSKHARRTLRPDSPRPRILKGPYSDFGSASRSDDDVPDTAAPTRTLRIVPTPPEPSFDESKQRDQPSANVEAEPKPEKEGTRTATSPTTPRQLHTLTFHKAHHVESTPAPHTEPTEFAKRKMSEISQDPVVVSKCQELCVNILAMVVDVPCPAVLIASTDPSYESADGVQEIAITMVEQLDDPVLLIDATHDATLTRTLGSQQSDALVEVVRGHLSWQKAIVQTTTPGLCLLPTDGKQAVDALAFQQLLTEIRQSFGLILIDVGAFDTSSALAISGVCSASFLMLREGVTEHSRAIAARRALNSWGANLKGGILAAASHE